MPSSLRPRSSGALAAAFGAALLATASAAPAKAAPPAPTAPSLPTTPARLWLIAPTAMGPWTLRIDNTGEQPIRIAADIRLLSFELDTHTKGKSLLRCSVPQALRPRAFPEKRALLLAPGKSYIEAFDPRLFCFGKLAEALRGSVIVRTRYGWDPPPKWSRTPPTAPFVAEGTAYPPTVAPLRELSAPTLILSYAHTTHSGGSAEPRGAPDVSAADAAGPDDNPKSDEAKDKHGPTQEPDGPSGGIVDENAAKLDLAAAPYSDASSAREVRIDATVTNTGHRPATVALRPRMLGFHVVGPDAATQDCEAPAPSQAMPRDMFRELKPGASVSLPVLVTEQCPQLRFERPGLYRVTTELSALESGERFGLDTWTGISIAPTPTLVRVATGSEPFDASSPTAVPTPPSQSTPVTPE